MELLKITGNILEGKRKSEEYDYTRGYREHGNGKYLADGETLEGVVQKDAEVLDKHGVTREEVGRNLRRLLSSYSNFALSSQSQELAPGVTVWRQIYDLGSERCPYLRGVSSNIDWRVEVEGLLNGNKAYHPEEGPTFVSDMLPEMIEKLGFFEGEVFYGIKPEWAIAVNQRVKDSNVVPYQSKYTNDAWSLWSVNPVFPSLNPENPYDGRNNYYVMDDEVCGELGDRIRERIRRNGSVEIVSPSIIAYTAPSNLDLRSIWKQSRDIERRTRRFWVKTKKDHIEIRYNKPIPARFSAIKEGISKMMSEHRFVGFMEISDKVEFNPKGFSISGMPLDYYLYHPLFRAESGCIIDICVDGKDKRVG